MSDDQQPEVEETEEYVDPIVRLAEKAAAESVAYSEELATPIGGPAEIHVEDFGAAIEEARKAAGAETMDAKTLAETSPGNEGEASTETKDEPEPKKAPTKRAAKKTATKKD